MRKRGISAIVATVLVILITVAGVAIIWVGVLPILSESFENVCLDADVSVVSGSGYTCYDGGNDIFGVQVSKGSNDVEVSGVNIILGVGGDSRMIRESVSFEPSSKRTFYFPVNAEPESVSVAPIVRQGKRDKICEETSSIKFAKCSLTEKVNLNLVAPNSLINMDSWEEGTGAVGDYVLNGGPDENSREWGTGPYGDRVLLWVAIPDSSYGADGGWVINIPIDHTKTYRSTVWIKRTGANAPSTNTYFGCSQSNTNNLDGSSNGNPYFRAWDVPEFDKWYLWVGYIHGSGYSGGATSYGGVYDGKTGAKVYTAVDFKNKPGVTSQAQRAYYYYDNVSAGGQHFWNPTFTEVSDYDLPIEIA
jgi:FlaG/FlaF family flagellin (archaellin)